VIPGTGGVGNPRDVVPLSLLAALCFGSFFVLLDRGTAGAEGAVLWVALGVDAGSLPTTIAVAALYRRSGGLRLPPARLLLPVALVGLLAVGGDVSLAYATISGPIGVVSVLASLDILVTVLLARFVLAERLLHLQSVGVGLSVVGVILISSD
jgi:drug/metabolite transporter (DMT)-like permease